MTAKSKAATDEQHRDFVKAARELGVDESEEAFDKVLKRVAKAPFRGCSGSAPAPR